MIVKLLVENLNKPFATTLEYAPEFNPRVHGPYDPAKYYGKGYLIYYLLNIFIIISIETKQKS